MGQLNSRDGGTGVEAVAVIVVAVLLAVPYYENLRTSSQMKLNAVRAQRSPGVLRANSPIPPVLTGSESGKSQYR